MKRKRTLKAFVLLWAMAAMLLLPLDVGAQTSFTNQTFGSSGGGNIGNQTFGSSGGGNIGNQTFGSSGSSNFGNQTFGDFDYNGNLINQTFGNFEDAPIGSGLLVMFAAGTCYAALKRRRLLSFRPKRSGVEKSHKK